MVADLREMQENQGFSEIWIDKFRFVLLIIFHFHSSEQRIDIKPLKMSVYSSKL